MTSARERNLFLDQLFKFACVSSEWEACAHDLIVQAIQKNEVLPRYATFRNSNSFFLKKFSENRILRLFPVK